MREYINATRTHILSVLDGTNVILLNSARVIKRPAFLN